MTRHDPIATKILAIAEPVCTSSGYELVDVRFTMDQGHWVLRVYIDRLGEPGTVDLHDCERMSRELSAVLDVEDPIPHAYSLEVSSPGVDRPLRTAEHFRAHVGAEIKVAMAVPVPVPTVSGGERRNFKGPLKGVEGEGDEAVALVEIDGKDTYRLPVRDIDQARLVPDWDAVMKGKRN